MLLVIAAISIVLPSALLGHALFSGRSVNITADARDVIMEVDGLMRTWKPGPWVINTWFDGLNGYPLLNLEKPLMAALGLMAGDAQTGFALYALGLHLAAGIACWFAAGLLWQSPLVRAVFTLSHQLSYFFFHNLAYGHYWFSWILLPVATLLFIRHILSPAQRTASAWVPLTALALGMEWFYYETGFTALIFLGLAFFVHVLRKLLYEKPSKEWAVRIGWTAATIALAVVISAPILVPALQTLILEGTSRFTRGDLEVPEEYPLTRWASAPGELGGIPDWFPPYAPITPFAESTEGPPKAYLGYSVLALMAVGAFAAIASIGPWRKTWPLQAAVGGTAGFLVLTFVGSSSHFWMIPLALGLLLSLLPGTKPEWRPFVIVAFPTALFLMLSMGTFRPGESLYEGFTEMVPPASASRVPARYLVMGSLGLSIMAASGADYISRRLRGSWTAGLSIVLVSILAVDLAGATGHLAGAQVQDGTVDEPAVGRPTFIQGRTQAYAADSRFSVMAPSEAIALEGLQLLEAWAQRPDGFPVVLDMSPSGRDYGLHGNMRHGLRSWAEGHLWVVKEYGAFSDGLYALAKADRADDFRNVTTFLQVDVVVFNADRINDRTLREEHGITSDQMLDFLGRVGTPEQASTNFETFRSFEVGRSSREAIFLPQCNSFTIDCLADATQVNASEMRQDGGHITIQHPECGSRPLLVPVLASRGWRSSNADLGRFGPFLTFDCEGEPSSIEARYVAHYGYAPWLAALVVGVLAASAAAWWVTRLQGRSWSEQAAWPASIVLCGFLFLPALPFLLITFALIGGRRALLLEPEHGETGEPADGDGGDLRGPQGRGKADGPR